MKINKNSFHYKWYRWTYSFWGNDYHYYIDAHTNLCQYFQRIFWMTLAIFLFILTVVALFIPITIGALLGGYRPTNPFDNGARDMYIPYPGLPVGKVRIYPWHVIFVALIIGMQFLFHRDGVLKRALEIEGGMLIFIGLVVGSVLYSSSDVSMLVGQWWQAKTEKVCPFVEFVDDNPSTKPEQP